MDLGSLQPVAAVLASGAALATLLRLVLQDRHPLSLIERLSRVASQVEDNAVRTLVADYRDERITEWVLQRRAPLEPARRFVGRLLQVTGLLLLGGWALGQLLQPDEAVHWVAYGLGLGALVLAEVTRQIRRERRRRWMKQEREWRHLPTREPAGPVSSSS